MYSTWMQPQHRGDRVQLLYTYYKYERGSHINFANFSLHCQNGHDWYFLNFCPVQQVPRTTSPGGRNIPTFWCCGLRYSPYNKEFIAAFLTVSRRFLRGGRGIQIHHYNNTSGRSPTLLDSKLNPSKPNFEEDSFIFRTR